MTFCDAADNGHDLIDDLVGTWRLLDILPVLYSQVLERSLEHVPARRGLSPEGVTVTSPRNPGSNAGPAEAAAMRRHQWLSTINPHSGRDQSAAPDSCSFDQPSNAVRERRPKLHSVPSASAS